MSLSTKSAARLQGRIGRMKECPMCGEAMRLSVRQIAEPVPGRPETVPRPVREWVCPECDYFEEAEGGEQ